MGMFRRKVKYSVQRIIILGLLSLIFIHYATKLFNYLFSETVIECRKLMENDKEEIEKALTFMKTHPKHFKDDDLFDSKRDCEHFKGVMGYFRFHVSDIEKEFPIAFGILTSNDVVQTERLFRAIYRPSNFYCIHVDISAPRKVHAAISAIAQCLTNVFIFSHEDVMYDHMTRLKADIKCMKALVSASNRWKYYINLSYQNFPLKPNIDIVKILKIYNGANDIEGIASQKSMNIDNYKYHHQFLKNNNTWIQQGINSDKVPYNATIFQGSAHGVFSRKFIEFAIKDEKAERLLTYLQDAKSPAEYYWATLNHNKVFRAPGNYLGNLEKKPSLAMYGVRKGQWLCRGKFEGEDCLFGISDLSELVFKKHLFINKLSVHYQYLAMQCLDKYLYDKTEEKLPLDNFYYRQLPFILK